MTTGISVDNFRLPMHLRRFAWRPKVASYSVGLRWKGATAAQCERTGEIRQK